jgi:hypothetical protein
VSLSYEVASMQPTSKPKLKVELLILKMLRGIFFVVFNLQNNCLFVVKMCKQKIIALKFCVLDYYAIHLKQICAKKNYCINFYQLNV